MAGGNERYAGQTDLQTHQRDGRAKQVSDCSEVRQRENRSDQQGYQTNRETQQRKHRHAELI